MNGRSAAAQQYRRWYYTPAWRQLRKAQLAAHPLCAMCDAMGRTNLATVVDHRQPHRGDRALFFNPGNLLSLCPPHHDATKQRAERGRVTQPIGADGWPIPC